MPATAAPPDDGTDGVLPHDEAIRAELDRIPDPALLYLPGGRIAALNSAAARLADFDAVGMPIIELLERYGAVRADGSPIIRGDLPYARALRGEVVAQGERITMTLPDGSTYRALVTSTPIIAGGKVVAALSVWNDFDAFVRGLASPPAPLRDPAEME